MQTEQEKILNKRYTVLRNNHSSHSSCRLDHNNFNQLKDLALQGESDAQQKLAYHYFSGKGVKQDHVQAFKWYTKAAEQGNFNAMVALVDSYMNGKGIDQSISQAVYWLKKVSMQNITNDEITTYFNIREQAKRQCQLGGFYFDGIDIKQDYIQAIQWFQKAAEHNNVEAMFKLADCYIKGLGVEKDLTQAAKWLERAANEKNNNRINQLKLAIRFYFGEEIEQNRDRAIYWFKKAADLGASEFRLLKPELDRARLQARIMLGISYFGISNYDGALKCFQYASSRNSGVGHLWLACMYQYKNKIETDHHNEKFNSNYDILPWWNSVHTNRIHGHSQHDIFSNLYESAANLFFNADGFDFADQKITDFIFPSDIIRFLENQRITPAKIILAFYYQCKKNNNSFLNILEKASIDQDIIAHYVLGEHYLNVNGFDMAINYFKKVDEDQYKENNLVSNTYTLETRHLLYYKIGVIKQAEIEKKNNLIEIKNKQMEKLVEQFTHTLGNVIFPDTIYQVAEHLKNIPDCRKDVLLLHEAYQSEIIIKLQSELLRQRYTNSNPEKFRSSIRGCRLRPGDTDKSKSIKDIFDYATSRVTARFLNEHYAGLNSIREKILSKRNVTLEMLRQRFEDDIILNKSLSPIAWLNKYLLPIQITEISSLWQKVHIRSDSYADALLFGYFSELLFNAFKYADHDSLEILSLSFDEALINGKTYLSCNWKNPVKNIKLTTLGTGKGLDAIQEDLKQLNETKYPEESLFFSCQSNQFQVTLLFKTEILVKEHPILKPKRKSTE